MIGIQLALSGIGIRLGRWFRLEWEPGYWFLARLPFIGEWHRLAPTDDGATGGGLVFERWQGLAERNFRD